MFTVAHNRRAHSDQSSSPKLQGLRAANASSLAHQITNSSAHGFDSARSGWQIELRIFAIGSELIDPSEELAHDHAYNTQSCCLAFEMPQLFEHGLQMGTIGQIESLSGKLVKGFAQSSASQSAISSASAVLQSADEMEVAELNDPALAAAKPDNPRNLIGDRGPDACAYVSRDCRDRLRPPPQILPPWQEHRSRKTARL
jgi:hypothetical protein